MQEFERLSRSKNMNLEQSFNELNVIDFSQGVAGPMCGLHLAQYGASVLKIEPIDKGEWGRSLGKRYGDFSALAVALNRGKKSLAIDLKKPQAKEIILKLLKNADVVIENYRSGVMKRLGFDERIIRRNNSSVIYLTIEGFGQGGPYRDLPATDSIMQAYSGLMDINRDSNGVPKMMLPYLIDYITGLYAFQAVSAALYKKARKGEGESIRLSLLESAISLQATKMIDSYIEETTKTLGGVPMGTFKTKDGFISINARRQHQFISLCKLINKEDMIDNPKYSSVEGRFESEKEIMEIVGGSIIEKTTAEWSKLLNNADILNSPVNTYKDFYGDIHARAANVFTWIENKDLGRIPMPRIPGLPPVVAGEPMSASPEVGEHSNAVLSELGYKQSDIKKLYKEKVISFPKIRN